MPDFAVGILTWLGGLVSGLVGAYLTYIFNRKSDAERTANQARDEQRRTDLAQYESLSRNWHKLLDVMLAYPEIGLEPDSPDMSFPEGSREATRRSAAYDLLLNIFSRSYLLKDALTSNERLSHLDNWDGWDAWATEYFKKASLRHHYADWKDRYCPPGVGQWLDSKERAAEAQET